MIEMKGISKTYRVRKREAGIGNAVKALFSREYTEIQALKDVSFAIPEGQIVGYIGPNGAGKSTTIKILSGILRPDSGECTVNGMVPWKQRKSYVSHLGVVCGSLLFFGAFLVNSSLCFFTLEGLEIMNIFTDGIRTYSKYPFDIYGKEVLLFTTFVIPMAMVQYWPLQYLVGRGSWIYGLFPVLSLWFLLPCLLVWRLGVRHYGSSGS